MKKLVLAGLLTIAYAAEIPSVRLTEVEQLRVENYQLRLQLIKASESELNAALTALFTEKCRGLGGSALTDCDIMSPSQTTAGYVITRKPKEEKKTK